MELSPLLRPAWPRWWTAVPCRACRDKAACRVPRPGPPARRRGRSRRAGPAAFHRRLPGYAPTPLHQAPALEAGLGLGRPWVKDETTRFGLPSYKILGASWAVYRMLTERLGDEPDWADLAGLRAAIASLGPLTLVAATDGNHGRAVARVARWLGHRSRILVPAGTVPARIAAIGGEGAVVDVVPGDYDECVTRAHAAEGPGVLVVTDTGRPGFETVPGWVTDGFGTIVREADEAFAGRTPSVVMVQMGVGALGAAVVRGFAHRSRVVVVVEPATAACGFRSAAAGHPVTVPGPRPSIMAGLNCGSVSATAWPEFLHGAYGFVTVDDGRAEDAVRDLLAAGIVAGETGAAGLAGLTAVAQQRRRSGSTCAGRARSCSAPRVRRTRPGMPGSSAAVPDLPGRGQKAGPRPASSSRSTARAAASAPPNRPASAAAAAAAARGAGSSSSRSSSGVNRAWGEV